MRVPGLLMTKCKSDRGAFRQCSASGQVAAGSTGAHRIPAYSAPGEIGVFETRAKSE